ncbi:helix-turn-helix domain-containing protein [Butyricicoccus faecihominis]|uniref:helix-turn-helix domain-containing protein n=1 Tax=Butyricicoccus faecihominis TaxID=1712515 RepID=UPI002478FC71|nr:helix-turn-helix domain-containing protein [Butyricicoccus faecihominis]MCQ5128897.1 helix-turn-helix domain-containing protein [Butyricicoccus faecihominis]
MMTKQAELKQKAYQSGLKSRALSILIYLIDRSNKDLTCFPAIPTMAEQLHISVSTVKRSLHELVDAGFIKKEARFREKNRGQTSNLYTLVQPEDAPELTSAPDMKNHVADVQKAAKRPCGVRHITFADIEAQETELEVITEKTVDTEQQNSQEHLSVLNNSTPVHLLFERYVHHVWEVQFIGKSTGRKLPCASLFTYWTGVGFSLHPP